MSFPNAISWRLARATATCALALFETVGFSTPSDVQKILADADQSRGRVDVGLEYQIDLACVNTDSDPTQRLFVVRTKNNGGTATTISPPERKNDVVLVKDQATWEIRSTSKQPVAVGISSRTSGIASVGDIVSMGFASTYDGVKSTNDVATLGTRYDLKAKAGVPTTYETAWIWIDPKTKLATQVQFLNVAQKPVRTVTYTYGAKIKVKGKDLPFVSEAKIADSLSTCTLKYSVPKQVNVDPAEFDIEQQVKARHLDAP